MTNTNAAKNSNDVSIMLSFFGIWIFYAAIHLYLQMSIKLHIYAGYLSAATNIGLLIIVLSYAFWLWRNAGPAKTKLLFGLYFFTYVFIFISNVIYNTVFNILHLTHVDLSVVVFSSYNIAYLFGLILLFLFFSNIVPKVKIFKQKLNIPIIVLLISIAANLTLFDWSGTVSLARIYGLGEGVFELASFVMAIACFVVAKNKGMFYLGLGYIIIIAADFIMNTGILSQHFGVGSLIETAWILGLLFVVFALADIKKNQVYATEPKSWINENKSLSTTFTLWIFVLCNLTLGAFLLATYLFSPALFF